MRPNAVHFLFPFFLNYPIGPAIKISAAFFHPLKKVKSISADIWEKHRSEFHQSILTAISKPVCLHYLHKYCMVECVVSLLFEFKKSCKRATNHFQEREWFRRMKQKPSIWVLDLLSAINLHLDLIYSGISVAAIKRIYPQASFGYFVLFSCF